MVSCKLLFKFLIIFDITNKFKRVIIFVEKDTSYGNVKLYRPLLIEIIHNQEHICGSNKSSIKV